MRTIAVTIAFALPLVLAAPAIADDDDHSDFGANKEASLSTREENGFGGHSGRVMAFGITASGTDFTRDSEPKDYSRFGGGVEFHYTSNFDTTRFKTLLGFDFNVVGGYATLKHGDQSADGGFLLRSEFGPSFGLIDFGGEHTGFRFTFFPAMGVSYDGGRFYETFAYFSLGGRLSAHLGEETDAHLQYVFVPGTTTDTWLIREHRVEAIVNLGSIALGARYQLDMVEQAEGASPSLSSRNPTLGLLVGYAF